MSVFGPSKALRVVLEAPEHLDLAERSDRISLPTSKLLNSEWQPSTLGIKLLIRTLLVCLPRDILRVAMGSESGVNGHTILWLTILGGSPNGLSIRHRNFGRNLKERGYKVHLLIPDWSYDASELEEYRKLGVIDGFSVFPGYNACGLKGAFSRLTIHPALRNYFRRTAQRDIIARLQMIVEDHKPEAILISDRMHLFAARALRVHSRVVIDWCDSMALNFYREFKRALKARELGPAARSLYSLVSTALDESYYPRFANANLVVCDPDRAVYRRLNQETDFAVLPNGIDRFTSPLTARVPDTLIFSGVMNFPPNYHSALWFIDHVLPLVRRGRPGVRFIVAGRDPVNELRARSNEFIRITGHVPDLSCELSRAQLYVAPMISGGGFKNKVVEALAAGTPVVGTCLAAEFLPGALRSDLLLADKAPEMAHTILSCLQNPAPLLARVNHAQRVLKEHYSWAACTENLITCLSGRDRKETASAVANSVHS